MTNADYQDPFWPAFFVIILFVVIAIFIRMLWRIMKDNNIFMEENLYHYAVSNEKQAHTSKNIEHFFELATTANIVGFVLFVFATSKNNGILWDTNLDQPTDYSWCYFCFNVIALVALYIYVAINEPVFAFFHNYKYVAKIWSTFLLLCPIPLILISYHQLNNFKSLFYLYCLMVVFLSGLGCLTYCVLMYAVNHYSKNAWKGRKRKNHIVRLVQPALFINCAGLAMLLHAGWAWVADWLVCAFILGVALRFYSIDKTIYTDDSTMVAEIIDDEKGRNGIS